MAHRTLCTLMKTDPSQLSPDVPLPATLPNVTFAYIKYLWHSGKRVNNSVTFEVIYVLISYLLTKVPIIAGFLFYTGSNDKL